MVQWMVATVSVAWVLPPAHLFFLSKPPFSPSVNALFDYLTGALATSRKGWFRRRCCFLFFLCNRNALCPSRKRYFLLAATTPLPFSCFCHILWIGRVS